MRYFEIYYVHIWFIKHFTKWISLILITSYQFLDFKLAFSIENIYNPLTHHHVPLYIAIIIPITQKAWQKVHRFLYSIKGPLCGGGPCATHTLHTSSYGPANETLLTLSSRSLHNNNNGNKVSFNNNEVASNNSNVVAQCSVCMLPQFATPRSITGLPVTN